MSKAEAFKELGLKDSASESEIKAARRKLALLHHPDKDPNGTEKMARINAAYERLTRDLHEPDPIEKTAPAEEDPWADFGDWESEDSASQSANSKVGTHLYITIDVPWDVANLGRNHVVTYKVLAKTKKITIKIPKGSASGKQIRCVGKGEPGANGGLAGDLYVTLNVTSQVKAEDIHTAVSLRVSETNSATVKVINVLVDGVTKRITVRIPANVRDGQTIKVTGVGNKSIRGEGRGDILVKVYVLPSNPGQDIETYAIVDGFLRLKMSLFGGANVTLRDVKTHHVVNHGFKLETRHKNGERYYWNDLGGVGDPGERRGKLWVTPRYTEGAIHFGARTFGVIAVVFGFFLLIGQINNATQEDTYVESSNSVVEEVQTDEVSWPPSGFVTTDMDDSFAFSFYEPDQYDCSDSDSETCIRLQVASQQDCQELDVKVRFYDSSTSEEEWVEDQYSYFQAGSAQDVELSIYTRYFDSVDSVEMYCSIA